MGQNASQAMNVSGVTKLFFRGRGRGCLRELAETRAGVGKAPGGQLDPEHFERMEYSRAVR